MKGIVILLLVVSVGFGIRHYLAPKDLKTEYEKDPQAALVKFAQTSNRDKGWSTGEGRGQVAFVSAAVDGTNALAVNMKFTNLVYNDISTAGLAESQPLFLRAFCSIDDKDFDFLLQRNVMIKMKAWSADDQLLFVQRITRQKCIAAASEWSGEAMPVRSDPRCRNITDPEGREACEKHFQR